MGLLAELGIEKCVAMMIAGYNKQDHSRTEQEGAVVCSSSFSNDALVV